MTTDWQTIEVRGIVEVSGLRKMLAEEAGHRLI